MADRRGMTDQQLADAVRRLGSSYPYPPTPNLARSVRARIAASPRKTAPRTSFARPGWQLALAAALVLLVVVAAALVNPVTRDAIAHFFQVRGVIVTRTSATPSVSPLTSLNLGQPTTLAKAQSAVGFTIAMPSELGNPDAVYLDTSIPGGQVALAYKPRAGLPLVRQTGLGVLVTEFRGDLVPGFITKVVGPGTTVEETTVHGDPGWWIAGAPHEILVRDSSGNDQVVSLRLAANTLVWDHDGVTYRIESSLSKTDAMKLAASMP